MKEFTALRRKALERRDTAITKARAEYAETIGRISLLERDLLGDGPAPLRRINESIAAVIPPSDPFTAADILASLRAMEPSRDWKLRAVHYNLGVLGRRGVIRCIQRCKHDEPAVYIRTDAKDAPESPRTLLDVITGVLGDKAMNLTELTMGVLDAGYKSTMERKMLRKEIATAMRGSGRFRCDGDRWIVAN